MRNDERDEREDRLNELLEAAIGEADPTLADRLEHDPAAYLDLVRLGVRASAYTDELLKHAVGSARAAGVSWEAIGAELGVSRQAAQQRFGAAQEAARGEALPGQGPTPAPGTPDHRVLAPLTAFNEMEVLERVGRYGWHSVAYGPFFHVVAKSARQWRHERVPAFGGGAAAFERAGLQRVGSTYFPWSYYKRELAEAALPEPAGWDPLAPDPTR